MSHAQDAAYHAVPLVDGQAEEAVNFYVSVFPNSLTTTAMRYGDDGPEPNGSVMTISFELDGLKFTAINGGPMFTLTEVVSFVVRCETQNEVDHYWNLLTADGGKPSRCGWLKERFALSWQIIPHALPELLQAQDPRMQQRVTQALMQMTKIEIAQLEAASRG